MNKKLVFDLKKNLNIYLNKNKNLSNLKKNILDLKKCINKDKHHHNVAIPKQYIIREFMEPLIHNESNGINDSVAASKIAKR